MSRGGQLLSLLKVAHPGFLDAKYLAFLVTTQSCDLVQRGEDKACAVDYVNIAGVRELETALPELFSTVCESLRADAYSMKSKPKARMLLERILNQNEQALGLFYLHRDPDNTGLGDYAVALLRHTATLETKHYPVLQAARTGRLATEHANRLGWLVGNLYSRVATRDWHNSPKDEEEMSAIAKQLLKSDAFIWAHKSWWDSALQAGVSLDNLPRDELTRVLKQNRPKPFRAQFLRRLKQVLSEVEPSLTPKQLDKVEASLLGDPFISTAINQAERDQEDDSA